MPSKEGIFVGKLAMPAPDFSSGLYARFKFNETSGRLASDNVGGALLTFLASVTWVPGKIGGCVRIVNTSSGLNNEFMLTDAKSVFLWVKTLALDGPFLASNGIDEAIFLDLDGHLVVQNGNNDNAVTSADSIANNQWHHVGFTDDLTVLTVYLDGAAIGTMPSSGLTEQWGVPDDTAATGPGASLTAVLADDLLFYGRALTANDVAGLAASLTGPSDGSGNAPHITSSNSFGVPENTTVVGTITTSGDTPMAITLNPGLDADLFSFVDNGNGTATVAFLSLPDFESPLDANEDNTYEVGIVRADNGVAPADTQTLTAVVTNVNEATPTFTAQPFSENISGHTGEIGWNLICDGGTIDIGNRSYQWFIADDDEGTNLTILPGQNTTTIRVPTEYVGRFLVCRVIADNVGHTRTAFSNYVLCIVPAYFPPRLIIPASYDDPTPFNGKRILAGPVISDVSEQAMPVPPLRNTGLPQVNVDWGFHAVSCSTGSQLRSNETGLCLVTPSFCIAAQHDTTDGRRIEFLQPDNTVVVCSSSMINNVSYWDLGGDFRLIKLDAPVTTIQPIPIVEDIAVLASRIAIAIELDRHLSLHNLDSASQNGNAEVTFHDVDSDHIEGGDSGHALVVLIDGRPVLIGAFHTAGLVASPSHYIKEMQLIIQAAGENLTIASPNTVDASAVQHPRASLLVNTSGVAKTFSFLPPHGIRLEAGEMLAITGDLIQRISAGENGAVTRNIQSFLKALDRGDLMIIKSPHQVLFDETKEISRVLVVDNDTIGVAD